MGFTPGIEIFFGRRGHTEVNSWPSWEEMNRWFDRRAKPQTRLELVAQEEWVSEVILGDEEQSIYGALGELNRDVICLGYDQWAPS